MLWASIGKVLPLVKAGLAVASNSVWWCASIGSDITNESVPPSILAVITCSKGESLTPLEWWHRFLHIKCVDGLNNSTGAFDGTNMGKSTAGIVAHSGKAI